MREKAKIGENGACGTIFTVLCAFAGGFMVGVGVIWGVKKFKP